MSPQVAFTAGAITSASSRQKTEMVTTHAWRTTPQRLPVWTLLLSYSPWHPPSNRVSCLDYQVIITLQASLSTQQAINNIARYRLRQHREISLLKHGAGGVVDDAMGGSRQCRTQGDSSHPRSSELRTCVLCKRPRCQSVHR